MGELKWTGNNWMTDAEQEAWIRYLEKCARNDAKEGSNARQCFTQHKNTKFVGERNWTPRGQ